MKNNPAALQKSTMEKKKGIAIVIVSIGALIGLTLFFLKATDHKKELRSALESRDNSRLEQLLKAHPGLVEAELPNRGPKDTWNPLHMAACYGDNASIEILLKHKAKVNAKDANGLTPLHYTVALSRYNSAQLLINKGADMNAKGRDGRSPLELAKTTRDKRMIELFRVRGAKE
ncbi:MAG: ankyrin repeat domain-containing protein [Verrucomicrobiota bacterium]